jgi:Arc/MetJ-type ribon-helix-helix transcriptional regulator
MEQINQEIQEKPMKQINISMKKEFGDLIKEIVSKSDKYTSISDFISDLIDQEAKKMKITDDMINSIEFNDEDEQKDSIVLSMSLRNYYVKELQLLANKRIDIFSKSEIIRSVIRNKLIEMGYDKKFIM